jgi:MoxR-like ATPase
MARVAWGEPVYQAADLFRQRVMVEGRSFLWPEHEAWTDENITAVFDALASQNSEIAGGTFLDTLRLQLEGLPDDAFRIAADTYAFYWFFPSRDTVSSATKLKSVGTISSWRGSVSNVPEPSSALLASAFAEGIGSPGQFYLLQQWEYLRFFLAFIRAIRRGDGDPFDSESCRLLVYRVADTEGIKSHGRHVLLHLLFPDDFEPTATTSQKTQIVKAFPQVVGDETDLDRSLRKIRKYLIEITGNSNPYLYEPSVMKLWSSTIDPAVVSNAKTLGSSKPQQLVEMLVPDDATRHRALTVLADAVELANGVNPKSWSITFSGSYVAVNVGQSSAISLNPGHLAFALSAFELPSQAIEDLGRIALEFDPDGVFAKAYPQSRWVRVSYDRLAEIPNAIWQAHNLMVKTFAAGVKTQTGFGYAHHRGVVDYLNDVLHRNIPQPGYLAGTPVGAAKYWKVTAGAGGRLWPKFRDDKVIAAEWPAVGDLRAVVNLASKDDLQSFISETSLKDDPWNGQVVHATNQLWSFWDEMKPGDRVIACDAKQTLAVGTIVGDYEYRPEDGDTAHRRSVAWEREFTTLFATLPSGLQTRMAFNANIRELTEEQFNTVLGVVAPIAPRSPTIDDLAKETFMHVSELEDLLDLLKDKKQLILEGPPGSGKTWLADKLARYLTGNQFEGDPNGQVELVQFHQSYGYEDFVQGIRPVTVDGALQYRVIPGIFTRLCRTAEQNPNQPFVLIIDEINRGNLSRIFGELLLLLEYRDRRVRLPYGSDADSTDENDFLRIPPNLYLIGTMNSTDRSLALIDYALRRRFYFHRLLPVSERGEAAVFRRWLDRQDAIGAAHADQLHDLFVALNLGIQRHLTEDFQVGHSYFMRPDIHTEAGLRRVWQRAVRPLLVEYFHGSRSGDEALASLELAALSPGLAGMVAMPVVVPVPFDDGDVEPDA